MIIAYKNKNLVDKSATAGFINNADLDKKVTTLATKAELKAEQNKILKLQVFVIQVIFEVKIILKMMVLKII